MNIKQRSMEKKNRRKNCIRTFATKIKQNHDKTTSPFDCVLRRGKNSNNETEFYWFFGWKFHGDQFWLESFIFFFGNLLFEQQRLQLTFRCDSCVYFFFYKYHLLPITSIKRDWFFSFDFVDSEHRITNKTF